MVSHGGGRLESDVAPRARPRRFVWPTQQNRSDRVEAEIRHQVGQARLGLDDLASKLTLEQRTVLPVAPSTDGIQVPPAKKCSQM